MDSLVIIPNERLKYVSDKKITLANAFDEADGVLLQGVKSISELIKVPGFINLDFADVTAVMKDAGHAHMALAMPVGRIKRKPLRMRQFPARCWKPPSTARTV